MIRFNATKLAAVALAQSTEEVRYYLRGVFFDGQIAVATDGHVLTAAHDGECHNDAPGIYPVSSKAITAMKKKTADTVTFDNGMLTVLDTDGDILHIEPSVVIDGTFPDWRCVIPAEIGGPTVAAFTHIVQRKLCDTAKTLGSQGYSINGDKPEAAHTVNYNTSDVFSVAMPYRHSNTECTPEWISKPSLAEAA